MPYVAFCLVATHVVAQSTSVQSGARSHGMGNVAACLEDVWSLTNNVAGLAEVKQTSAAASFHAIPSFKHFNRMSAVMAMPMGSGVAGAGAVRFGDDVYNEHVISVGFANTFGLASLGIKGNYLQYRAEGRPAKTAFTLSFGGVARLTPHLLFGACIININQPTINRTTGEKVQTALLTGLGFRISETMFASAEIQKEIQRSPVMKVGMEYHVYKKIAFRTGFNFNPASAFAGLGFRLNDLHLDYAMQWNDAFGLSHQATVVCPFQRK